MIYRPIMLLVPRNNLICILLVLCHLKTVVAMFSRPFHLSKRLRYYVNVSTPAKFLEYYFTCWYFVCYVCTISLMLFDWISFDMRETTHHSPSAQALPSQPLSRVIVSPLYVEFLAWITEVTHGLHRTSARIVLAVVVGMEHRPKCPERQTLTSCS